MNKAVIPAIRITAERLFIIPLSIPRAVLSERTLNEIRTAAKNISMSITKQLLPVMEVYR